jgi:phage gp29-like protein
MAPRKFKPKSEDGGAAISPPIVRTWSDWTPQRIRIAERQAEGGTLDMASGICDWLLTDDRVAATLDARIETLLGLVPTFEPSGDRRRSNKAVKALEAGEDWWKAYPTSQLTLIHKWALLLGVSPARHQWQSFDSHGGRLLPMPKFWHPQTLVRHQDRGTWTVRDQRGAEHIIVAGDGEWILHTPFGEERPWAYGLWRSLAPWVLLKLYARLDSGRAGEEAATGVVTTPDGSTKEQRRELAQSLLDAGAERLAVLPAGYDMKLLELSAQTGQFYESQIGMANAAIAIRIRGGNLSTEVKGGSFAAAASQKSTGDDVKLKFDAEALSGTLNEQSLSWWAEFNFGSKQLAPWPAWPVEPDEDRKAESETLSVLGDAIRKLQDVGMNVDLDAFAERFDVPIAKVEALSSKGQIFEYHFKFGIVKINEARARLGLEPIADGDRPPSLAEETPNGEDDATDTEKERDDGGDPLSADGAVD